MIKPSEFEQLAMMVKFKVIRTKEEFKAEIPAIPQVGETVTIHEPEPVTYKVKSIEHEIKGGTYNANVILSSLKV